MINISRVDRLPPELFEALTPKSLEMFRYWKNTSASIVRMSPQALVLKQDTTPLAAVGALKLGYLSAQAELWFVATKHLTWMHLPALRELWDGLGTMLINESYRDCELYARTIDPKASRFVEWFGGKKIKTEGPITFYRMH